MICVEFAPAWFAASRVSGSGVSREDPGQHLLLPAVLAGIFGIGLAETAYADADRGGEDVQGVAKKERERIEELLRKRGVRYGSYPRFTVAVKGQKVIFCFVVQDFASSSLPSLIENLRVIEWERNNYLVGSNS